MIILVELKIKASSSSELHHNQNIKKGITWNIHLNGIRNEDRITATSEYLDKLNTPMMQRLWIRQDLSHICKWQISY
jgi:hypothetical protein